MVHTENNEKKKDNKEVKKHFKCFFFTRREIHKEMTNQDTQGISKIFKNEFKKKEVNEKEKKKAMETKKR